MEQKVNKQQPVQGTAKTAAAAGQPAGQTALEMQQAQAAQHAALDAIEMDKHKKRTVEDIRLDILCGVDLPEEEREMEVKDLYEQMQMPEYKALFGNTVERNEFFKHMHEFRERLTKSFFKREINYTAERKKNAQGRMANDAYMAGKIDMDGNGAIDANEIESQWDRVSGYISKIEEKYDNMAWNMVQREDFSVQEYIIRKHMAGNSKFNGFSLEEGQTRKENDKTVFTITDANGKPHSVAVKFNKGEDRRLDRDDEVNGMEEVIAHELDKVAAEMQNL